VLPLLNLRVYLSLNLILLQLDLLLPGGAILRVKTVGCVAVVRVVEVEVEVEVGALSGFVSSDLPL
jgi:hypothetical protein